MELNDKGNVRWVSVVSTTRVSVDVLEIIFGNCKCGMIVDVMLFMLYVVVFYVDLGVCDVICKYFVVFL